MGANEGATTLETRKALATEVFRTTSHYDNAIWKYLSGYTRPRFPKSQARLEKVQDLRYGENPHQAAAFYRFDDAREHTLGRAEQLQGKELSYNNILDTDACWAAVREFDEPACVIVKHTNPCGIAVDDDITAAYKRAHDADSISAYGGVMAFNRTVPASLVQAIFDNGQFVEVMIAPDYDPEALELLATKKNLRVLRTGGVRPTGGHYESRAVEGGMLVQTSDSVSEDPADFKVVTHRQPTAEEMEQLLFAWRVAKSVKSNAILLARNSRHRGRRRRSDEPRRLGAHRHREGGRAGAGRGVRVGRVHAVPRLARGLRRRRRHRGHPARRLGARRGGHRDCRPARRGDGVHRTPPLPALGAASRHRVAEPVADARRAPAMPLGSCVSWSCWGDPPAGGSAFRLGASSLRAVRGRSTCS